MDSSRYASLHGIYYVDAARHGTIFVQGISSQSQGGEFCGVPEGDAEYTPEYFGFVSARRKYIQLRLEAFQERTADNYRVSEPVSHFRSAYTVLEACLLRSWMQLRRVGSSTLFLDSSLRPKRGRLGS